MNTDYAPAVLTVFAIFGSVFLGLFIAEGIWRVAPYVWRLVKLGGRTITWPFGLILTPPGRCLGRSYYNADQRKKPDWGYDVGMALSVLTWLGTCAVVPFYLWWLIDWSFESTGECVAYACWMAAVPLYFSAVWVNGFRWYRRLKKDEAAREGTRV